MKKLILTIACVFIAGFTFSQEMSPAKAQPKKAEKGEQMQKHDADNSMGEDKAKPAENKVMMTPAPPVHAEPAVQPEQAVQPEHPKQPAAKSKKAAGAMEEAPKE